MNTGVPEPEPAAGRRRVRWSEIVAWLVIVGALFGLTHLRSATSEPGTAARMASGLQMKIMARYCVGVARLFPSSPQIRRDLYQQGLQQLTGAPSSLARLRWAMIAGEMVGADEPKRLLKELLRDPALDQAAREDAVALESLYGDDSPAMSETARERLLQRHGWYARLALSRGLVADHPDRQAAILPALRTFVGLVVAVIVGGLLLLAGLALWVIGLVRWQQGKLRAGFDRPTPRRDGPRYVEVFALVSVLFMGGSAVVLHWWQSFWGVLAWYGIVSALLLGGLRWRSTGWLEIRRAVGLHAGRGWWREIGAGVMGYLATLPVLVLAALLMLLLVKLAREPAPMHPVVEWLAGGKAQTLIPLFLMATLVGPLFEELMFRGVLYQHLRHHLGWVLSALVMGFVFAAIHPQGWFAVPPLMTLGFAFGCLREWRGSLLPCVCAHVLNNTLVLTLAFLLVG
jgi:membrane protease YdiL (CAAX protease family)